MSNLIVPIPRVVIQECINDLHTLIRHANAVTRLTTLKQLEKVEHDLHRAWGMYTILAKMDVLPDKYNIEVDLKRITEKIIMLKNEKSSRSV